MPSMRQPRGVACPTCHASWARRSARFCGRCGEPLTPTEVRARVDAPRARAAVTLIAAAMLLVIAVTTTLFLGGRDGGSSPPTDPDAVTLPDPGDVSSDDGATPSDDGATPTEGAPPARSVTDPVVRDLPRVTCTRSACTRWSTPLPDGRVLDLGETLLHVERKVGPPTDWPEESREEPSRDYAFLTAVTPEDGAVLWDAELRLPNLSDRAVQAIPADDLYVVAWDHKVLALDARTGARRWSNHLDPGVHLVQPGQYGDVLVWWADDPVDDEVARDQHPGGGAAATVPGVLASLDLADGGLRWRAEATPVLVTDTRLVTVSRDDTVLQGVDLRDGSHAWSRELPSLTEARPIPLADDRALVWSEQRLEVLDLATGTTLFDQAATTSMAVTAVGTTAIVHPPELRPTEGRTRASPTSIHVHDLTDPAGAPTQIEGAVAVRPLIDRSSVPPTPWQRLPSVGVAIIRQPERDVEVTLLGHDGEVLLDAEAGLTSDRCCWQLLPGSDAHRLVLLDPDAVGERVVALSTDDLARGVGVNLPGGMVVTDVVRTDPLLLLAHGGDGVGRGLWLASSEGLAGMLGRTELVRTEPFPIVMTVDGLIGLDLR